jgi:hypothetical protein
LVIPIYNDYQAVVEKNKTKENKMAVSKQGARTKDGLWIVCHYIYDTAMPEQCLAKQCYA